MLASGRHTGCASPSPHDTSAWRHPRCQHHAQPEHHYHPLFAPSFAPFSLCLLACDTSLSSCRSRFGGCAGGACSSPGAKGYRWCRRILRHHSATGDGVTTSEETTQLISSLLSTLAVCLCLQPPPPHPHTPSRLESAPPFPSFPPSPWHARSRLLASRPEERRRVSSSPPRPHASRHPPLAE